MKRVLSTILAVSVAVAASAGGAGAQLPLVISPVRSGGSVTLSLETHVPGSLVTLAVDGEALPPGMSFSGITLAVSPAFFVLIETGTNRDGGLGLNAGISADPALVGILAYVQGVAVDPGQPGSYSVTTMESVGIHPPAIPEAQGIPLALSGDAQIAVPLQAARIPFFGSVCSTLYVSSNGRITFEPAGPDPVESIAGFLTGAPCVAALWDDLEPGAGGQVVVSEDPLGAWVRVLWFEVPHSGAADSNTVQVDLYANGAITLEFGAVDLVDALVGVTPGHGLSDVDPVDLSAWPYLAYAPGSAVFELFSSSFDLEHAVLSFVPRPTGEIALLFN